MGLYAGNKKLRVMLNGKAYKLHAVEAQVSTLSLERPAEEDQTKGSSEEEQTE